MASRVVMIDIMIALDHDMEDAVFHGRFASSTTRTTNAGLMTVTIPRAVKEDESDDNEWTFL